MSDWIDDLERAAKVLQDFTDPRCRAEPGNWGWPSTLERDEAIATIAKGIALMAKHLFAKART